MVSKLYLHVGHGKSGSSFIQSCLAKSQNVLSKNKICYPLAEQERLNASLGNITSGNGNFLLQDNFYEIIKEFIHPNHEILLFSNESLLTHILKDTNNIQKKIFEICKLIGVNEINILLIIRNPFEIVSSVYQQGVKRAGWYLDIDDYLEYYISYFSGILDFLNLVKQWDNVYLKVLNYSYCKNNIIAEVENWLRLRQVNLLLPEISIVNRSMTRGEIELLKLVNKSMGVQGVFLSDPLCQKLPNISSDMLSLSSRAKKIFLKKTEFFVTKINSIIDPKESLSLQEVEGIISYTNSFSFTQDQLQVITESFASVVAGQNNRVKQLLDEVEVLREAQHQLINSLLFKISKKLNAFPRIKKLVKVFFRMSIAIKYFLNYRLGGTLATTNQAK